MLGDSGVAGRADDVGHAGFGGKPGDQRVLARAAADDKNSHVMQRAYEDTVERRDRGRRAGEYFVDLGRVCA